MAEVKEYFGYLYEHARRAHAEGMTAMQAARSLAADRWAQWEEAERLVVNLATIYGELDGNPEPVAPLAALQGMAELAGAADDAGRRHDAELPTPWGPPGSRPQGDLPLAAPNRATM